MSAAVRLLVMAAVLALLPGCSSEPVRAVKSAVQGAFQPRGDNLLAEGIRQFEDANYPAATRSLQGALAEGLSTANQVTAHKYLAFIHCVSDRRQPCQDEFRRALELDPTMELSPAEVGHPIWGPAFRAAKTRR
jgi:Tfp pilus assembly protein PilF